MPAQNYLGILPRPGNSPARDIWQELWQLCIAKMAQGDQIVTENQPINFWSTKLWMERGTTYIIQDSRTI